MPEMRMDSVLGQAMLNLATCSSQKLIDLVEAASLDPHSGDLADIDLSGQNLSQQDLRGWDLSHASFAGANLNGADLRGAKISGHQIAQAINWETAFLDDALLSETRMARFQMFLITPLDEFLVSHRLSPLNDDNHGIGQLFAHVRIRKDRLVKRIGEASYQALRTEYFRLRPGQARSTAMDVDYISLFGTSPWPNFVRFVPVDPLRRAME